MRCCSAPTPTDRTLISKSACGPVAPAIAARHSFHAADQVPVPRRHYLVDGPQVLRDPLYRETAHFSVDTGRPSVASLVNMILMQLELAGIARP